MNLEPVGETRRGHRAEQDSGPVSQHLQSCRGGPCASAQGSLGTAVSSPSQTLHPPLLPLNFFLRSSGFLVTLRKPVRNSGLEPPRKEMAAALLDPPEGGCTPRAGEKDWLSRGPVQV